MPELPDTDVQNLLKINSMMDGQKALLMPDPRTDEYWLVCIEDEKNKQRSLLPNGAGSRSWLLY